MPALISQPNRITGTVALVLSVLAILLAVSIQNTECASASSGSCPVGDTETFASGISINTDLTTNDTVISGDTAASLFFADSSTDRIGIGTNIPTELLDIAGNVAITNSGTLTLATDLAVTDGGTGVGTFTDAGVLIGNGTGNLAVTSAGTTGQYLTSNGPGVDPTFQTPGGGGISEWDQWRLTTAYSNSGTTIIATNLERSDNDGFAVLGSGMSHDVSGHWTFPGTGYWAVTFNWMGNTYGVGNSNFVGQIVYTDDNWASNHAATQIAASLSDGKTGGASGTTFFYISDVANQGVRFTTNVGSSTGSTQGHTDQNRTFMTFVRYAEQELYKLIFKTLTIAGMFAIAGAVLFINQASVMADEERIENSEHLISALTELHPGQWFGFKDGIQTYENIEIYDPQYSIPTKTQLSFVIEQIVTRKNTNAINDMVLKGERLAIENRLKDGTYSDSDIVRYLRILGDF